MRFLLTAFVVFFGLEKCFSARSKTRNNHRTDTDYNKYFVDRSDQNQEPYFISSAKTYQVKLGTPVQFHCQVGNIGEGTVIWKKDNRLISAGDRIIRKDPRIDLEGYNLTMMDVSVKDEGEYICEVESFTVDPIQQSNILSVLIPASVQPQPSSGQYTVREGTTMTLECLATGNPEPIITWKKESSVLPNGDKFMNGPAVQIDSVHREHDGIYVCMADNGVGNQATANISLTVLHAPYIKMQKKLHTGKNKVKMELSCLVQAEPRPEVRWYKDTMLLDPSHHRQMETMGDRHTLILHNLQITDFGNYSCVADNGLGRDRASLLLSGKPEHVEITSNEHSRKNDQYTLTWQTVSLLRVDEYRILYRPVQVQDTNNLVRHRQRDREKSRDRDKNRGREWTTSIIQAAPDKKSSHFRYESVIFHGQFTFYTLEPESRYEVLVQARNELGWSDQGQTFTFSTPRYNVKESSFFGTSKSSEINKELKIFMVVMMVTISITTI